MALGSHLWPLPYLKDALRTRDALFPERALCGVTGFTSLPKTESLQIRFYLDHLPLIKPLLTFLAYKIERTSNTFLLILTQGDFPIDF